MITRLRENEALVRRLADSNVIGIFCWDIHGYVTDANDAFCRIIGHSRDTLLSKMIRWCDFTPPEYLDADRQAMDELMRTGSAMPYEKEFIRDSGERVQVLIGGTFFTGSQENGIAFVVDLSERRRVEQALRESEERYRIVTAAASDAIVTVDESNMIVYVNPSVEKIFGYPAAQLLGQPLSTLIPDCLWHGRKALLMQNSSDKSPSEASLEAHALHRNGHELLLEISIGQFHLSNRYYFTAIARDITERKKADLLRHGQNEVLEMIAAGAPLDGILDKLIRLIESQTSGMYGSVLLLDEEGVHVRQGTAPNLPFDYINAFNGEPIGPQAGSCGTAMYFGKPVIVTDIMQDELWAGYRTAAAQFGLRACWSTPIFSSRGTVLGSFAMYYREPRKPQSGDLYLAGVAAHMAGIAIERHQAQEHISYIAHHDALTGLPNRLLLRSSLSQAILHAQRQQGLVALLFIDLDNFKRINDSLGHHIGDVLLQKVARRLQSCLRRDDLLARIGGDEFVIILSPVAQPNEAALVADKVLKAFAPPIEVEGHELHAGGSIGISIYPADGEDADTLMRAADTAMYHAKESGRGNFQFFTQGLNVAIQRRLTVENKLRQALARGEFELHYQPQVDMASGRILSAEALLRWREPDHGLVSPLEFVSIAEETGLILPIGEWVLREACAQLQRWQAAGWGDLGMAVNLSTRQMSQLGLSGMVEQILREYGVRADLLDLEITESILMQPSGENMATLQRLSDMGVRLSIDDFGTGYSSLSYLKRFPVDVLKIDRSFVCGIGKEQDDMAIADAIIGMAKGLHLQVIAEGVETAEQAAYLTMRNCHMAQGYFYGKPLTSEAFAQRMQADWLPL
ncbi:sensor domain-containing protein [Noviherbaspirillum autotrophicum]|uniref:sensor domain-containing protein n=1 Tax=Noviherbaspirillum autotrophicum TaxID=709839 RepID=UPI000694F591|nr:EAL domain-containing protein [Noviherbaspirillum autotrophicum]